MQVKCSITTTGVTLSDRNHSTCRPTAKKVPPPSRKSVVSAVGTPRDTPEGTPQPGSVCWFSILLRSPRLVDPEAHLLFACVQSDVINQYEWVHNPLPFKNPGYAAIKAKHSRTKKTAKQILAMEQTRGMNLPGMDGGEGSGTATPEKVKRPRGANLIGRGKRKKMEEESVTPSEAEGDVDMDKKQAETPAVLDPSIPPKREVISCKLHLLPSPSPESADVTQYEI